MPLRQINFATLRRNGHSRKGSHLPSLLKVSGLKTTAKDAFPMAKEDVSTVQESFRGECGCPVVDGSRFIEECMAA